MTISTRISHWQLIGLGLLAAVVFGSAAPIWAQGLSGVPRRLDETLGRDGQDAGDMESDYDDGYDEGMDGYDEGMDDYDEGMDGYDEGMDGYDEGMDDYGMDGYGGAGGRSGPPASDAVRTYGENLISLMGEIDLAPLFAAANSQPIEVGPVLAREAEKAFQSGNQGLALELMFGHMAAEYQEAIPYLKSVKVSTLLKRPAWTVRWGVSMSLRGETVDDPSPIREGATPMRSLAGGGGGFDGGGGYDAEMEMEMDGEMEMMEEGYGEDEMSDMEEEMMADMGGSPRSRQPVAAAPVIPDRKTLSDEAGETLQKHLGLVATVVAEKIGERFANGDFGPLFKGVAVHQEGPLPMSSGLSDALAEANATPMWKPGIVYLGTFDSYKEALPAAKDANVDVLLQFDIFIKKLRNDEVQNTSRARLLDVATGKSIVTSQAMDTAEAAKLAAAGRMGEREYVEEQLETLLDLVDREVKVVNLRRIPASAAQQRISAMLASPDYRTLRTLAEIRLYQLMGLLNADQVEEAFYIVGGAEALTLLHGATEDRVATARKWAVESQTNAN